MEFAKLGSETIFLMPNWKWVALAGLFAAGFLLQKAFQFLFSKWKGHSRLKNLHIMVRHFLELPIQSPLAWVLISLLWHSGIEGLELGTKFEKYLLLINQVIQCFYLIRLAYLGVEAFGLWIDEVVKKTENTLDDQLAPMATKTLKVFVVIFGSLILLQNFGFNVMSLLAGLGLGGLALALAAQDTAANVFGSITIILDRPFQVGDYVKVGDTEGTVEEIGFRSTRIRSFYQSLISIPNAVMAKEKIDNMGARPTRRIRHVLGVTCDTSNMKLQQYMEQIRYYLTQHPLVTKEDIRVNLQSLGDFSLQVLVQFFVITSDTQEEFQLQEDFLIEARVLAEKLQVEFAFPTQTLQLQDLSTNKPPQMNM